MSEHNEKELEKNVLLYVEYYLKGFNETIEKFYKDKTEELRKLGFLDSYFFLYKREIGIDFSVAIFNSDVDFFVFFIKPVKQQIKQIVDERYNPKYGREWTFKTPDHIRKQEVMKIMGLAKNQLVAEHVCVPSQGFIMQPDGALMRKGESHGIAMANKFGKLLDKLYPQLIAQDKHTKVLIDFRKEYQHLKKRSERKIKAKGEAQKIGHDFESLIRNLVEYFEWQPKKIRILGEEDDFTAIYEGNHILCEVRWHKEPLNGDKVRAFAGKLDPRPQTVGLVVSYSGFDNGAYSVARKKLSSGKAIVFFHKEQIDLIIEKLVDPGEVFSRELRDVYDYLFEKSQGKSK